MLKKIRRRFVLPSLIALSLVVVWLSFGAASVGNATLVSARYNPGPPDQMVICHFAASGHEVTLELPAPSAFAHLDNHEADLLGACED